MLALALASCGDGDTGGTNQPGGPDTVTGGGDVEQDVADTADTSADTVEDVDEEVYVPPCDADPGAPLCPCDKNEDCNSDYCIPASTGNQVCTTVCIESCPGDLECKLTFFPGSDPTYLCVDLNANLCRPCRQNSDCQGNFGQITDRCVGYGDTEGAFCGVTCGDSRPCPDGYECQEVSDVESGAVSRQCVPTSGQCGCSVRAVIEQASTACANGACVGSRVCTEDGLSACSAATPETEVCDGVDNNCNGSVDEGFPNTDGDPDADCVDDDDDDDGIVDVQDNCPLDANPLQEDDDEDGVGDACDTPQVPVLAGVDPEPPANDNAPTVTGTGEPGSQVRVFLGSTCSGDVVATAVVAEDGTWSVAITVEDDTSSGIWADAVDVVNGNASDCTETGLDYVEDSTAPVRPTLQGTDPSSPGSALDFDVLAVAEVGAEVALYNDADCTQAAALSAVTDAEGAARIAASVTAEAEVTYWATATDAAGNASACSGSVTYRHDSTPPAAPTLSTTIPESPSDTQTEPIIVGEAEPGSTVTIYASDDCSGAPLGSAESGGNGLFTVSITVDSNSANALYATATDQAGNVSPCSPDGLTYIHDDEDPAPPVLVSTDPASPGNTTTPTVHGTSEPYAEVRIYLGEGCTGFLLGETTADGDGDFSVVVPVAANAETFLSGQATDLSGRASECSPTPLSYRHDGGAPAAIVFIGTDPDSPSPDATPTVTGLAEPGASISLFTDAACTVPVAALGAADAAGAFAFDVPVAPNATTTFWGVATDPAGNASPCSADSISYVHDDIAPDAPIISATNPASPAAAITPNAEGTAEANALIAVFGDEGCAGMPLGEARADADGGFAVPITVAANTTSSLYATATDAAGNVSGCSLEPVLYLHDDSQPLVPTIDGSDPESPSRDDTSPVIFGTAEAGTTVELHRSSDCGDDAPAAEVTVDDAGQFSVEVSVQPNSTTTFYAMSTDEAGNPSPCSPQGLVYVHDDIAPDPPTLDATSPASPSNASTSPTVIGSTDPHGTVTLYTTPGCQGETAGTASADADGRFTVSVTAADNATTTWYAAAVDEAGNASTCTPEGLSYTHDAIAPNPPVLVETVPASPSGSTTPTVNGTAEAASALTFYTDAACGGSVSGQGAADAAGAFSVQALVGANTTSQIHATATDAAGNVSACSAPLAYTNDSAAPVRPVWVSSDPASPSAASTSPSLMGTTDPGVEVRLFVGNLCTGDVVQTTTSGGDGAFTFTAAVSANSITRFYAAAVDEVGNTSPCSDPPLVYIHDTLAPAPPLITGSNPSPPAQDATPDIAGSAEVGSTVRLYTTSDCSGAQIGQATADATMSWTVADAGPVADNATTQIYGTATDQVGNTSGCSAPWSYVHDTIAPAAPVLIATDPVPPSNDRFPDVAGTAEAGATVRVYARADCGGAPRGTGTATASGDFSIRAQADSNTVTSFYAQATDRAGNVGPCSTTTLEYLHDSSAPNAPVMGSTDPTPWSAQVSDPVVSGQADPNLDITIYGQANCGGSPLITTVSDSSGSFSLAVEIGPANRQVYFAARATDDAGNVSGCSANALFYRYDDTPPSFGGVGNVDLGADTTREISVSWSAASDNFTTAANMVYDICLSQRCGAVDCDFDDPASQVITTSDPGATAVSYGDLEPNTRYYVLIRARDEVGNREANERVLSVKTEGHNSAVSLAVGADLACLGLSDGGEVCWGPGALPVGVADPVQLDVGSSHSCAVRRTGQVRCWGDNTYGQLGNNSTDSSTTPVAVSGISNAVKVGVGANHSCALLADGRVMCWGRDEQAQLGNGVSVEGDQLVPVAVTSDVDGTTALSGAVDLAVGWNHACVIRGNGETWCWGANGNGQLGTGDRDFLGSAASVIQSDLIAIEAGQQHTCGLGANGRVYCWGWNQWGQVGNDTWWQDYDQPHDVGLDQVIAIGSSFLHTCAVRADGTAWCWGENLAGQIGNTAPSNRITAATQVQGLSGVVEIGGGDGYTCARRADGTAWCWGSGEGGRLGHAGSDEGSLVPLQVDLELGVASVTDISIDHEHACAAISDGTARCWGRNTHGQLGNGESGQDEAPLVVVAPLGGVLDLETGGRHSCATTSSGLLHCWGANDRGQLGLGHTTQAAQPHAVGALSGVRDVALGYDHTCAVQTSGEIACWGDNTDGQLGDDSVGAMTHTPNVLSTLSGVIDVAAGRQHTCAVTTGGQVFCWGRNDSGQVNGVAGAPVAAPSLVPGVSDARAVTAGGAHSCALIAGGEVRCWGSNEFGQLGDGSAGGVTAPTDLAGDVDGITAISAGERHTCALRFTGGAYCWGHNATGEVGVNLGTSYFDTPRQVGSLGATEVISCGDNNTCARTSDGVAWCWGDNDALALGVGLANDDNALTPMQVRCLP
ncbi:MAG: hypothetical protein CSA66_04900 [Proteobacteria bacterium]|nr:MAG: hypothetical protein CSA66_04900 [Pseudomonadota bacterium]